MDKQELDGVKQLLEAALKNLSDPAGADDAGAESVSLFVDRSGPGAISREAPVIVILTRGVNSQTKGTVSAGAGAPTPAATADSCGCHADEKKHSHPGLERFTIEADSHPSVPKTCFMEPGRACVNSGACEMRGF